MLMLQDGRHFGISYQDLLAAFPSTFQSWSDTILHACTQVIALAAQDEWSKHPWQYTLGSQTADWHGKRCWACFVRFRDIDHSPEVNGNIEIYTVQVICIMYCLQVWSSFSHVFRSVSSTCEHLRLLEAVQFSSKSSYKYVGWCCVFQDPQAQLPRRRRKPLNSSNRMSRRAWSRSRTWRTNKPPAHWFLLHLVLRHLPEALLKQIEQLSTRFAVLRQFVPRFVLHVEVLTLIASMLEAIRTRLFCLYSQARKQDQISSAVTFTAAIRSSSRRMSF